MPSAARIFALAISILGITVIGCRQNPNQPGFVWPWQQTPSANANNPPNQNLASAVNPPNPNAEWPELAQLMRTETEQSRLSDIQKAQLERLTEFWRQQQTEIARQAQQKRDEQLANLQAKTLELQQMEGKLKQLEDLRRQALELDNNNRDLHTQLAQVEQEKRLMEDQVQLIKQQLQDTTSQLQTALQSKQQTESQVSAMQANLQKRSRASISANHSALMRLEPVNISGLMVRQDGDVIRIELPSDKIFSPQTAAITPAGQQLVDQVASAVGQHYPRQRIGVEAHTDNTPLSGGAWRSLHQLSAAQAMAVFDYFAQRHRFNPRQMFVLGHGPNYPVGDNRAPGGQTRNRRVEVVIYPEQI